MLEALLWGPGVTCWVGVPGAPGVPLPARWAGQPLLCGVRGVHASPLLTRSPVHAVAAGLVQRHLLTPFHKGETSGANERYGPSCTVWEARRRVTAKLGAT